MSNSNSSIFKNRIEFIIALMTKEYDDAEEYGRKILEDEPENEDIANALSLLKQRSIEQSSSDTSSDSSLTDDSEDEQNTEDDLESDVDESSDSEIKIDATKCCQSGVSPPSDADLLTQHLSRLTGKDISYFNFEKNLQRVIIVNQDKCGTKL